MTTIQCANPPHHHNGFMATWRLWTASGGGYIYIYIFIYTYIHTFINIDLYEVINEVMEELELHFSQKRTSNALKTDQVIQQIRYKHFFYMSVSEENTQEMYDL